jgi:hypothetical protein
VESEYPSLQASKTLELRFSAAQASTKKTGAQTTRLSQTKKEAKTHNKDVKPIKKENDGG